MVKIWNNFGNSFSKHLKPLKILKKHKPAWSVFPLHPGLTKLQKNGEEISHSEVTQVCTLGWVLLLVGFNLFVLNRNCSHKLLPTPETLYQRLPRACTLFLSFSLSPISLPVTWTTNVLFPNSLITSYFILQLSGKNKVMWGHLCKIEKPEPPTCSCSSK